MIDEYNKASVQIENISLTDFIKEDDSYGEMDKDGPNPFLNADAPHYVAMICMMNALIGKELNINNHGPYLERRAESYGPSLGMSKDDSLLKIFKPSLDFCSRFYSEVKMYWIIRRRFMSNIFMLSQQNNMLGLGMKIVKNMLRGAEMANFSFINQHLVLRNADVLAWAGVEGFLPHLIAAYTKYYTFGESAP